MDEKTKHKRNVKTLKKLNSTKKKSIFDGIGNIFSTPTRTPIVTTKLQPRSIQVNRLKTSIEAYRGSVANLFTSNDPTLTDRGCVRLFTDTGYYGDVQKCQTIYQRDDLVGGLVDALVNSANTKLNFDLPSNNQDESEAWEQWVKMINIDSKSNIPGAKMLNQQIFNSMVLTGMAVVDIEWGVIKVGKKTYEFPTTIAILPTLGVKLQASTRKFGDEEVLLGVSDTFYKDTIENATTDVAIETLFTDWDDKGNKAMVRKNAYPIKFRHSPNNQTLYPVPLLNRSMESIALRHKMIDADISTLELIINKIIQIKVGDETNPPKPSSYDEEGKLLQTGDIEEAQDLFESLEDEVEVIATPYNYNIEVVSPDSTVLLDQGKYVQSTFNIYANFGIMLDPSSNSNSVQFEKLNLKNYEKNAVDLQSHVGGWYLWLASMIIKRNKGKLKVLPQPTFDKPDIYPDGYLENLIELYTIGGIDIFTVLEKYGLEPQKIKERKVIQDKDDELWEAPATFKQQVVNGSETKTVSNSDRGNSIKKGDAKI